MSEGKTFEGGSSTKQSMFEILEKCKSAKQLLDHHRAAALPLTGLGRSSPVCWCCRGG